MICWLVMVWFKTSPWWGHHFMQDGKGSTNTQRHHRRGNARLLLNLRWWGCKDILRSRKPVELLRTNIKNVCRFYTVSHRITECLVKQTMPVEIQKILLTWLEMWVMDGYLYITWGSPVAICLRWVIFDTQTWM